MPIEILENVSLAPLTTLKVGGPARYFATARSENDIVDAFEYADLHKLDVFVLGGGSNILVSDKGFDGLALHIALTGTDFGSDLRVAAGENWDTLGKYFHRFDVVIGAFLLIGFSWFVWSHWKNRMRGESAEA